MSYFIELASISDIDRLKLDWLRLEDCSDCSYFQSWGWIAVWLRTVVNDISPEVVRVWDKDNLVAIGIIVKSNALQPGILNTRKLFINEAPVLNRNMVVEYNGLLVKKGYEAGVYEAVIYHLWNVNKDWDEFCLGKVRKRIFEKLANHMDAEFYLSIEDKTRSWQFNSTGIKQGVEGICSALSRNRRNQVNRSFRIYEQEGEVNIYEAKNVEQALEFFDGLKLLHTSRWRAKGKGGSFANRLWELFHRELITSRFVSDEIQLLKIATPKSIIGFVYNFLWRGRVYVLQTGFNMDAPKGGQPGYVSHIKAIIHNQNKNFKIYDLLSEDSGYKNTLCNQTEELVSVSFKRIAFKSMLRQASLSSLKDGYVGTVIRCSFLDRFNTYSSGLLDFVREKWIRINSKWPSKKKKLLLVGAESSGTTAVSDLLFKGINNLRYLEEGEQQWVWSAYRNIYQNKKILREYPRLQLFDAIKVPGFSVIINEFLAEFPNTTVVYLVRDPRDFASSAIKTWKIGHMDDFHRVPWTDIGWLGIDSDDPVERLALRWKAYINAASKVEGVIFIKYEDFCQDKVGVIEGLCKRLQLPFDGDRVRQLCDVQLSHTSVRAYQPSGPGGWQKSILEERHIQTIENVCRDEMRKWGYDFSDSEKSVGIFL